MVLKQGWCKERNYRCFVLAHWFSAPNIKEALTAPRLFSVGIVKCHCWDHIQWQTYHQFNVQP